MVALEVSKMDPGLSSFTLQFLKPSLVIFLSLEETYLFDPTSVGVNQFIEPFQKTGLFVAGVPPLTTWHIFSREEVFPSPVNPGNLKAGTLRKQFHRDTTSRMLNVSGRLHI